MDVQRDTAIVPFCHIFSGLLGTRNPSRSCAKMIQNHYKTYLNLQVLDLGCGKGAVSIKLAKALRCKCHGIDAVPEFIAAAKEKAKEYGVDTLCQFEAGDVREK